LFSSNGEGSLEVTIFDHAQKGSRAGNVGAFSDIDEVTLFCEDQRLKAG
jgi:hypothetical protein